MEKYKYIKYTCCHKDFRPWKAREKVPCPNDAEYWILFYNIYGEIRSIQFCEKHIDDFNDANEQSLFEGWKGRNIFQSKEELLAFTVLDS